MKMGKIPVLDTINKIPGGLMIIPLLCGCLVNTFCPSILDIGGFTTAFFKSGASAVFGVFFICSGSQIQFKSAGTPLYKGVVINFGKVLSGVACGVLLAKIAGPSAAILGVTPLAMIGAMSNCNGGLYTALASNYGDNTDVAALAVIATNDGPFFEMMFMGIAGVAQIPIKALIACIIPILVGMVLGNLDEKIRDFLKPGIMITIPMFAFPLGAGMNLKNAISAGIPGLILGVATVVITGIPTYFLYRLAIPKSKRHSCVAGFCIGTTAGNAVATPAAIALVDPAWEPYVETATAQVAASVIITALLVPVVASFIYKFEQKHNLLNMDVPCATQGSGPATLDEPAL